MAIPGVARMFEKREKVVSAMRRIESAIQRCGCTAEEFLRLAMLAGNPPQDFKMAEAVKNFTKYDPRTSFYKVPKFVTIFADMVLEHRCPSTCPRVRGPVCRSE